MKNVYYINLDERVEKKNMCEDQLNKLGWEYQRFSAIKHENGAHGCLLSHIQILEMAKEKNLDYVIIFEDDLFIKDIDKFKQAFEDFLQKELDYDMLKIGANAFPPYKNIHDGYVDLNFSLATHGYMIKRDKYDIFIKNYKQCKYLFNINQNDRNGLFIIDTWTNILIHRFNKKIVLLADTENITNTIHNLYVTQRDGFSNCENRYTNYSDSVGSLKISGNFTQQLQNFNNFLHVRVNELLKAYEENKEQLDNIYN